jgi:hypothetical protein
MQQKTEELEGRVKKLEEKFAVMDKRLIVLEQHLESELSEDDDFDEDDEDEDEDEDEEEEEEEDVAEETKLGLKKGRKIQ